MLYINQLERSDVPYRTDLDHPDSDLAVRGTVKECGCGICSVCMMLDRLCMTAPTLQECIEISYSVKANREAGTDMKLLGAEIAKRYGLYLNETDEIAEMEECLRRGGCAVINVGGDREGHTGVFSHGGHYIAAVSYADGFFRILDPSWRTDKYTGTGVKQDGVVLYATAGQILADTANRTPAFYLFEKRA